MERIINSRLYCWREEQRKLRPNHAGFRKGRHTIDQLIRLTQDTANPFEKKDSLAAVFVDLKQAYNHVWRAGLLYNMQKIGMQGNVYHWIKHYLHDRSISTKVNDSTSKRSLRRHSPSHPRFICPQWAKSNTVFEQCHCFASIPFLGYIIVLICSLNRPVYVKTLNPAYFVIT